MMVASPGRISVVDGHAGGPQGTQLQRGVSVEGGGIDAGDALQTPPAVEVASRRQPIAAVVALSADGVGAPATEAGDLPAGGFHQPDQGEVEAVGGEAVDLTSLSAGQRGEWEA